MFSRDSNVLFSGGGIRSLIFFFFLFTAMTSHLACINSMVFSAVNLSIVIFFFPSFSRPCFLIYFLLKDRLWCWTVGWSIQASYWLYCIDDSRDIPYLDADTESQIFIFIFGIFLVCRGRCIYLGGLFLWLQ